jgi:5-methylcytosine-specific restriction endonuclease McrA
MITTAHSTPSSAAASAHAPARLPLELLEARQLRDSLKTLLRAEQSAMADFLVALADFDRRRGWEALGHASLFAFMRVEFGLSRSGAYWRLSAARLVQRFPQVIEPLRDGRLCMSTTAELARVLTKENRSEVLPRFFGLSAREAREVTAELAPRQELPARDLVTRLEPDRRLQLVAPPVPAPVRLPMPTPTATASSTGESVQTSGLSPAHPARIAAPSTRDDVEPLTADLRRLHVTVSRQFLRELETARDGLSHAIPNATTEQVLQAALRLLLEKQAKTRGQVRQPRALGPEIQGASKTSNETSTLSQTSTEHPPHRREGSRAAIPAAVRRAVWARDGGRCSWPLDGGGCCGSTHRLELDHLVPWAERGGETEANLRVVCAAHNRLAARQAFGESWMGRYLGARESVAVYSAISN